MQIATIHRRRNLARRLAIFLSTLVLAFAVAEAANRGRLYGAAGLSPTRFTSLRTLRSAGIAQLSPVKTLRYELVPNLRTWFMLHPFETNSHGMRDREYALEKPAGTLRIAVVGDSYTMGFGVPIESVFHSVLEERLNRAGGDVRYECLNFGVAGYGLMHYAGVIEHKVAPFEPDLILLATIANDVYPPAPGYFTNPPEQGIVPASPRSYLYPTLLDPVISPLMRKRRIDARRNQGREVVPLAQREELGRVLALGEEAAGSSELDYVGSAFELIARASEAPVFCVYVTTRASDPKAAVIREAAAHSGFGFLDTSPLFQGTRRTDFRILQNDGHPNEAANEMYAGALEEVLARDGWLSVNAPVGGDAGGGGLRTR